MRSKAGVFLATAVLLALSGLLTAQAGLSGTDVADYTLWQVRLPRLALAVLLGAGLGVAGCLLQGATRNGLADPEIIGVNQGASLFVVLALLTLGGEASSRVVLAAAFAGAAVGGGLVYALSFHGSFNQQRIILAGLAVGFFFGSTTTGVLLLRENELFEILYWLAGKLSGASWFDVQLAAAIFLPCLGGAWLLSNQLNVLAIGDEVAAGLGQSTGRVRTLCALTIAALAGTSVALAGPIGFVGLMVPHIGRRLVGSDFRTLLPLCLLLGALLLVLADLGAQWLLYPSETPAGVITALLGTPFFLSLVRRRKAAW